MELSPQEVRELVLADHQAIRVRLVLLRRAIERADATGDAVPLIELLRGVLDQLSAHLDLEDQVLLPVLRTIDVWGAERVARVTKEHTAQRGWIQESREQLARNIDDLGHLSVQALTLIELLEVDMAHEEESVLSPKILSDEVIQIDFGG